MNCWNKTKLVMKKKWVIVIAVLIAVLFVAAMVLHRDYKPQIIGKISPEDASQISKLSLGYARGMIKGAMKNDLKSCHLKGFARDLKDFLAIKPISLKQVNGDLFAILLGTGTNRIVSEYGAVKDGTNWYVFLESSP
jgi:hypothetical protein